MTLITADFGSNDPDQRYACWVCLGEGYSPGYSLSEVTPVVDGAGTIYLCKKHAKEHFEGMKAHQIGQAFYDVYDEEEATKNE
jgi:hypothetical protein